MGADYSCRSLDIDDEELDRCALLGLTASEAVTSATAVASIIALARLSTITGRASAQVYGPRRDYSCDAVPLLQKFDSDVEACMSQA